MSLATGQNKISYDVSVSTSIFAFPYKYWETSDLVVKKEDQTTGLITELIAGTDYSLVAVNGDPVNGASITLNGAVDNHTLVIERIVPLKSDANFSTGDGIPPESLNPILDKFAAQTQQINDQIGRQISFPATDVSGLTYEIPSVSVRKSKVLAFDSLGSATVVELSESGAFAADSTKGISITSNIASCKADDTSIEFDTGGNISVKDDGIETVMLQDDAVTSAKMAHIGDNKILGNLSGGSAAPSEINFLDEADLVSDSDTAIPSQQSVKAYVDALIAAIPSLNMLVFKDEKADGTGGGAFSSGSWLTRAFAQISNTITGASIASNAITLPAGTYEVKASAPAYDCDQHQAALYQTSGTPAFIMLGTSEFTSKGASDDQTRSVIEGTFTLASEETLELRHQCGLAGTFGQAGSFGEGEVYTVGTIKKIG